MCDYTKLDIDELEKIYYSLRDKISEEQTLEDYDLEEYIVNLLIEKMEFPAIISDVDEIQLISIFDKLNKTKLKIFLKYLKLLSNSFEKSDLNYDKIKLHIALQLLSKEHKQLFD